MTDTKIEADDSSISLHQKTVSFFNFDIISLQNSISENGTDTIRRRTLKYFFNNF
jgi:hypothetical protein